MALKILDNMTVDFPVSTANKRERKSLSPTDMSITGEKELRPYRYQGRFHWHEITSKPKPHVFKVHSPLREYPGTTEFVESTKESVRNSAHYSGRLRANLQITAQEKEKRAKIAIQSLIPWMVTSSEQITLTDLAFLGPHLDKNWQVSLPDFTKLSLPKWNKTNPVQKELFKSSPSKSKTTNGDNQIEDIIADRSKIAKDPISPQSQPKSLDKVLLSGIKPFSACENSDTQLNQSASDNNESTSQLAVYTPCSLPNVDTSENTGIIRDSVELSKSTSGASQCQQFKSDQQCYQPKSATAPLINGVQNQSNLPTGLQQKKQPIKASQQITFTSSTAPVVSMAPLSTNSHTLKSISSSLIVNWPTVQCIMSTSVQPHIRLTEHKKPSVPIELSYKSVGDDDSKDAVNLNGQKNTNSSITAKDATHISTGVTDMVVSGLVEASTINQIRRKILPVTMSQSSDKISSCARIKSLLKKPLTLPNVSIILPTVSNKPKHPTPSWSEPSLSSYSVHSVKVRSIKAEDIFDTEVSKLLESGTSSGQQCSSGEISRSQAINPEVNLQNTNSCNTLSARSDVSYSAALSTATPKPAKWPPASSHSVTFQHLASQSAISVVSSTDLIQTAPLDLSTSQLDASKCETSAYPSPLPVASSSAESQATDIADPVVEIQGEGRPALHSRVCLICLRLCGTDWELTSHVCSCCICRKVMDRGDVDIHMWRDHGDVMPVCDLCDKRFVLPHHLILHERREHPHNNLSMTMSSDL